jgi:hypothetical protein
MLALVLASLLADAPVETVLRRTFNAADAQRSRYAYVPFEVAAGVTRFDIAYTYDRAGGTSAIDLGLLEPGPLDLGTSAWRGWSGGNRDAVFVAADDATPGYWPGPLPAGTWHVALGLYKVAEAGTAVEIRIRTAADVRGPAPTLARRGSEPQLRDARWYAGGLHAHTLHSDGVLPTQEVAALAREAGLDFLTITDHNNTTHQRDAIDVPGLLVIAGEEVTTPAGHANVWGLRGDRALVDFRAQTGADVARLVADAHAQGALFSINHPFLDCAACSWTGDVAEGVDALEISNPGASGLAQALALWDTLLRAGRRITAVGASDWHRPGAVGIGTPAVRVHASELSTPAILRGIREGRVIVMTRATLPPPSVVVRSGLHAATIGETLAVAEADALEVEVAVDDPAYEGARVELVWRGEAVDRATLTARGTARFRRWPPAGGYLRVQVTAADGAPLAITNPVFVTVAR